MAESDFCKKMLEFRGSDAGKNILNSLSPAYDFFWDCVALVLILFLMWCVDSIAGKIAEEEKLVVLKFELTLHQIVIIGDFATMVIFVIKNLVRFSGLGTAGRAK